ncbi:hypothetical protein VOLCADRAFT_94982 [Volvox carteri f. nagariensis]|uniref:Uncharacterized protein n=1 Tax=Volvox carteri f. nagariensis TaxID=3068 RepID=D8U6A4_VOLCA|nr:uncharacterized protein VOLCADRAFT_94982 [Volvox carteri f. nagariensis]EFJ44679.1 hypothetical protein VOLCADRAFT_94982 [Volvox carteri f. nagariensis]|eukprot:XP_002954255.1 hypothetical protein VOLCADRAFT_94982 [Volvox carteri f. nagariensis]
MVTQVTVAELDQAEDVGFYFKYIGGITFANLSSALEAPGATSMVTASSKHGLVFFSDLSGVYAVRTDDLLPRLCTKVASESYVTPRPADVCLWHKPLGGITQLALSTDESVLAAVDGPAGSLGGIKQFSWCKAVEHRAGSGSGPGVFLVVDADRSLRVGRYGDADSFVVVASSGVEGADWCPAADGDTLGSPALAYSTGGQLAISAVVSGSSGSPLAVRQLACLPLEHPQGLGVVFESVRWLLPDTLLLGGSQLVDDGNGDEGGDEYSSLLVLSGWAPNAVAPPQGAALHTDLPMFVEEDSTPRLSGPYLHAVAVPRWGALVRCHRKAVDDHVRLMRTAEGEFGSGGSPQAVAVTEEPMMIRLPNGPDGGSNYVLGLGLDTSMPLDPLPNPLSAEKPPLVPPPVLLILTSDGVLRVYGFGHVELTTPLRPRADAAVPLPTQQPEWAVTQRSVDVATSGTPPSLSLLDMTDAAAKAALPSDGDDDLLGDDDPATAWKPGGSETRMSDTSSPAAISMAPSGAASHPGPVPAGSLPSAGASDTGLVQLNAESVTAAEDLASRVALPDSGSDDGLLEDEDDDAQERRRAAAAAGIASDSESGEEVTSPGVVPRSQTQPVSGPPSAVGEKTAQPSTVTFPAACDAFGGGMFGSAASSKPSGLTLGSTFGGFGAGFSMFGASTSNPPTTASRFGASAPTPPSMPTGDFCFGSGFAAALPTSSSTPAAPPSPWGSAVTTGLPTGRSGKAGTAASVQLQPTVAELDQAEDVGFYFKYIGGITFANLSSALEAPGATSMVTASSKHGLVFFSDLSGVYAVRTDDLLPRLCTKVASESYVTPRPADVCLWHKPLGGITQLALSTDESVLAAVDGPAGSLGGIKQFSWCKAVEHRAGSGSGPGVFLVVDADRSLRVGRYGDADSFVVVASSGVEGADWCPAADGDTLGSLALAYSTGGQLAISAVVSGSSGSPLAVRQLACLPLEHPQGLGVVFESVRWLLPDTLLLGGSQLVDDGNGDEGGDEYSSLLVLSGWAPNAVAPPQGAALYTDLPMFVEEDSTPRLSGPYLHAVAVPRWGALVRCHRKAVDDHVRLMRTAEGEFGSGGSPQAVAVTEEPMMIRLPNGPDGGSNYVLGLGLDTSMPLDPLPNPLSAEKPPLVPPPVLLILTSDGVLRVYGFGHPCRCRHSSPSGRLWYGLGSVDGLLTLSMRGGVGAHRG